jgi:hypothetical protein
LPSESMTVRSSKNSAISALPPPQSRLVVRLYSINFRIEAIKCPRVFCLDPKWENCCRERRVTRKISFRQFWNGSTAPRRRLARRPFPGMQFFRRERSRLATQLRQTPSPKLDQCLADLNRKDADTNSRLGAIEGVQALIRKHDQQVRRALLRQLGLLVSAVRDAV